MTIKNQIYKLLKEQYPRIVHKGEIDKISINEWGHESETAGRECRILASKGLIERILDAKGRAQYRWIPEKPKTEKVGMFDLPIIERKFNLPN